MKFLKFLAAIVTATAYMAILTYAVITPDPMSENVKRSIALQQEMEYENFISCLSEELRVYHPEPTDAQHDAAVEWCSE
jgi:hypothetical protein